MAEMLGTRQELTHVGQSIYEDGVLDGVSVILPAYQEELGVGQQIDQVIRILHEMGIPHEIILVDDGSSDRTADIAFEKGIRVLRSCVNQGYGASLKKGILKARFERIVVMDADGTYGAKYIPDLLKFLDTADMVVGARIGEDVHIPSIRKPAKKFLTWLGERISGQKILDLNSGLRSFRRAYVRQYFHILPDGFSFTTTITLGFLSDNYRIVYLPIDYHQRIGRSKIVPRNFFDFIILVLRIAIYFEPLRVFLPLSFSCGVLGILKVFFDVIAMLRKHEILDWSIIFAPVMSTSALLLLITGFQFLIIGMVCDSFIKRITRECEPLLPSQATGEL